MDGTTVEPSGQGSDLAETAARLVAAFSRHDTEAYFDHFARDASFIFYTVTRVLRSRAQYEELWSRWEAEDGFRVRACVSTNGAVRMLGDTAAVFTHDVATTVETNRGVETVSERETIIFECHGGRWLAVHEHLSPAPADATA